LTPLVPPYLFLPDIVPAEPEFHEHLKLKLLEAHLTLIVYDTTDEETWRNVERLWLPMVNEIYDGDLSKGIMIIGTKVDMLLPNERSLLEERKCSDQKMSAVVSKYLL
jgi:hypothetical protein